VIHNIVLNYYNLENLTNEEKEIYQNPKSFKALLTSPWIRVTKDIDAEVIGMDNYLNEKNPEQDPFFAQIENLKVRDILKRVY
jgi:hypothetical protein